MMTRVATILAAKGISGVCSTHPDSLVTCAAKRMVEHGVGSLIVLKDEQIVGIVTEREFVRHLARSEELRDMRVRDIMCVEVRSVRPESSNEECMLLMTERRVRHVAVVNGRGRLEGLISIGDLVKEVMSDQRFAIEQLQLYIAGSPCV